MSTVQTFVKQTKAAATASTYFLNVTLVDYIQEVSEKAIEKAGDLVDAAKVATYKVGDAASVFVKGAAAATHKLNLYSDKMYFIGIFNRHLKTVAEEIGGLDLLFQGAQQGTFKDRALFIINQILTHPNWVHLRAKIIALKDFRDLAMEASQPKSKRLINYIKNTLDAGQLAVINALRNAFGYAPIVAERLILPTSEDVDREMTDLDVVHNVVALAFDPFDATNLHNMQISMKALEFEIEKMLKIVYARGMIANTADEKSALQTQIDIVKGRDYLMKQLSIEYTAMKLKGPDPGPLLNQIVELMRNANIMTRNTMVLVQKDLGKIFNILLRVTGSVKAQDAREEITRQLAQMERDKTDWGGKYMSQRFKYNRIPPIIKALTIYVLSIKGSDNFKRAQEIITEYNQYIEQIREARLEIYKTLGSRNLVPFLGRPGQSVQEKTEAYEVFVTTIINTHVPTQHFPSAFPDLVGIIGEDNNNSNWSLSSSDEDDEEGVKMANKEVEQEIIEAQYGQKHDGDSNIGNASGNNNGHISMNEAELEGGLNNSNEEEEKEKEDKDNGMNEEEFDGGLNNENEERKEMNTNWTNKGGKRKQTRKRSSKKSKKSKKTKRMKKVKRTMKKNKGKKGKKASRKRR